MDHIFFKVEILSNEDREWHESFSLVLGPDDPVEAVLGDVTTATVTILDQEAAGSLILPAPPIVSCLIQRTAGCVSPWPGDENWGGDRSLCVLLPRESLLLLPPYRECWTMSRDISTWYISHTGSYDHLVGRTHRLYKIPFSAQHGPQQQKNSYLAQMLIA